MAFFGFFRPFYSQNWLNLKFSTKNSPNMEKKATFQKSGSQQFFVLLRGSYNQKTSFPSPKLREEFPKVLTFLVHFRQFCHTEACVWDGTCIKGRGGGSGSKNFFLVILIGNLVYFHPLFTEFENLDLLTQNWRICRGGRGPRG